MSLNNKLYKKFETISHSADLRFKVFGDDLKDIFQNAVLLLALISVAELPLKLNIKKELTIDALDKESLLVDFLNEILTKMQVNKAVYPEAQIISLNENKISAVIFGAPINRFKEEIKAVTYYRVKINKNKEGLFETDLLFDI